MQKAHMRKLLEVEQAKALMNEAAAWSVMRWLREKKRVRQVADQANAALDELDRTVKARWSHEVSTAYQELLQSTGAAKKESRTKSNQPQSPTMRGVTEFVRQVKEADDEAYRVRMDAERTFDEAERLLSTSLAREGCKKAIRSWDLHEKAIQRAEKSSDS
jgi:hypothetical protein